MSVQVGDMVLYRFSEKDAKLLKERRQASTVLRARSFANVGAALSLEPSEYGNRPDAENPWPAVVVAVWSEEYKPGRTPVNLKVFCDGEGDFWVTSVCEGEEDGQFVPHRPVPVQEPGSNLLSFPEALALVEQGCVVARLAWPAGDTVFADGCIRRHVEAENTAFGYTSPREDVNATDWYVVRVNVQVQRDEGKTATERRGHKHSTRRDCITVLCEKARDATEGSEAAAFAQAALSLANTLDQLKGL